MLLPPTAVGSQLVSATNSKSFDRQDRRGGKFKYLWKTIKHQARFRRSGGLFSEKLGFPASPSLCCCTLSPSLSHCSSRALIWSANDGLGVQLLNHRDDPMQIKAKQTAAIQLTVTPATTESPLRTRYAGDNLDCHLFSPLSAGPPANSALQACPEDSQLKTQLLNTQARLAEATGQLRRVGGRDYDRRTELESLKLQLAATQGKLKSAESKNERLSQSVQALESQRVLAHTQLVASEIENGRLTYLHEQQSMELLQSARHTQAVADWSLQLQQHNSRLSEDLQSFRQYAEQLEEYARGQAASLVVLQQEKEQDYRATLLYAKECEAVQRQQLAQLSSLQAERNRLQALLVTATDQHILVSFASRLLY